MPASDIRIGPFVLRELINQGGFGEIWRAEHDRQKVPVAIKVVKGAAGTDPTRFQYFHREVRAAAQLNHPNIVAVFDYGAVPPAAANASGGRLQAGTPYLAMEFGSAGSLDRAMRAPMAWAHVRRVLISVLEALAHAHARGVVHRDIKPQNILLPAAVDLRPTIRLADFGIAQAFAGADAATTAAEIGGGGVGSPAYMSPEQCMAHWRDHGPWTDLYALGIVAWELITGFPPFAGESVLSIAIRHMREPIPTLVPRFEIPDGVEGWIARMTAKAPRDRFQHARDAAWALAQLDPDALLPAELGDADLFALDLTSSGTAATYAWGPNFHSTVPVSYETRVQASRVSTQHTRKSPHELDVAPPLAEAWALVDEQPQPPLPFVDVGIGLFGLRRPAVIGRESERDTLWHALRDVVQHRSCRGVVLRGDMGTGKSRLAAWLAHTAAEAGAVQVFAAQHEADVGPAAGIGPMFVEYYRCTGLDRERMARRIDELLVPDDVPDHERSALAHLLADAVADVDPTRSQTTTAERFSVYRRALQRAARERPVLLWLDDVQWGTESVAFVEHLLERDAVDPMPVLIVMTARGDAPRARSAAVRLLDAIIADDRVAAVDLKPLRDDHIARLLERTLRLSPGLARQVTSRSNGIPLFAVEVVSDWVHRALLRVGDTGFELAPGATVELPDSLHVLWSDRVAASLQGTDPHLVELARLAATLGIRADLAELRDAWSALGQRYDAAYETRLGAGELCAFQGEALVFGHPMLRESLLRSAREAGSLPALHMACATMLQSRQTRGAPVPATRRGRHLVQAGSYAEAVEPLRLAARAWSERSAFDDALQLADELDAVAARLPMLDALPVRCDAALARADVYRLQWAFGDAAVWSERALELARQTGADDHVGQALTRLANVSRQQGNLALARTYNDEALTRFRACGDDEAIATTLVSQAIVARVAGDLDDAEARYRGALDGYRRIGLQRGVANSTLGLGNLFRGRGDLVAARDAYDVARTLFGELSDRAELANVMNGLAEVARMSGELDVAEPLYVEALEMQVAVGSRNTTVTRLNLSIVEIERGEHRAALERLTRLTEEIRAAQQFAFLGYAWVFRMAASAGAGDHDELREATAEATRAVAGTVDPDLAMMAERASTFARERGWHESARAAAELAAEQYEALGRAADAERLRAN